MLCLQVNAGACWLIWKRGENHETIELEAVKSAAEPCSKDPGREGQMPPCQWFLWELCAALTCSKDPKASCYRMLGLQGLRSRAAEDPVFPRPLQQLLMNAGCALSSSCTLPNPLPTQFPIQLLGRTSPSGLGTP